MRSRGLGVAGVTRGVDKHRCRRTLSAGPEELVISPEDHSPARCVAPSAAVVAVATLPPVRCRRTVLNRPSSGELLLAPWNRARASRRSRRGQRADRRWNAAKRIGCPARRSPAAVAVGNARVAEHIGAVLTDARRQPLTPSVVGVRMFRIMLECSLAQPLTLTMTSRQPRGARAVTLLARSQLRVKVVSMRTSSPSSICCVSVYAGRFGDASCASRGCDRAQLHPRTSALLKALPRLRGGAAAARWTDRRLPERRATSRRRHRLIERADRGSAAAGAAPRRQLARIPATLIEIRRMRRRTACAPDSR